MIYIQYILMIFSHQIFYKMIIYPLNITYDYYEIQPNSKNILIYFMINIQDLNKNIKFCFFHD